MRLRTLTEQIYTLTVKLKRYFNKIQFSNRKKLIIMNFILARVTRYLLCKKHRLPRRQLLLILSVKKNVFVFLFRNEVDNS